jgi:hypothetical protein
MIDKTYSMQGSALPVVLSCQDIGVIVSCDLSQSAPINVTAIKARQRHACAIS